MNMLIIVSLLLVKVIHGKYTVHVVPHSHDDPGWINTFEEYYNNSIVKILSNTVESLIENSNRTFVFSEISFFKPWYLNQTEETQLILKQFVKEKRFEFVNGGYVMEDHATCYYQDAINQLRLGMDFLYKEFEVVPNIGWFLDPFGHSTSHSYIFEQFDYDTIVLGRGTQTDKQKRMRTTDFEFSWIPINSNKEIFTHMIQDYYCPPAAISKYADDKPLNFTPEILALDSKNFLKGIATTLAGFKHNHYILYFGCDFTFKAKNVNYNNIETLMKYMNTNMNDQLDMKYSTVENYFNEVKESLKNDKKNLTVFHGDFFPYVDQYQLSWTGFFTSRPYLKGIIREHSIIHSVSLYFFLDYFIRINKYDESIYKAQEQFSVALAINQHHDAIAGTAKTNVSDDYIDMLNKGYNTSLSNYKVILKEIYGIENITMCLGNGKSNMSCNETIIADMIINNPDDNNNKTFGIINPGLEGKIMITFEYKDSKYASFDIYDNNSHLIIKDSICIPNLKCFIFFYITMKKSILIYPLHIRVNNKEPPINPMERLNIIEDNIITFIANTITIEKIIYNKTSNQFNISLHREKNKDYQLSFMHGKYTGEPYEGAYIFKPLQKSLNISNTHLNQSYFIKGKLATSLLLRFDESFLLISFFNDPLLIHLITVLDPFPSPNTIRLGYDYLLLVNTSINNVLSSLPEKTTFWTDSNGMKMVKRNNSLSRIEENFYPINTALSIREHNDSSNFINIFTDRPQGASSLFNGQMMIMVNRYSIRDDNKGVNEPLLEPQSSVKGFSLKHIVSLNIEETNDIAEKYFLKSPLIFKGDSNEKKSIGIKQSVLDELFIVSKSIQMEVLFLSQKEIIVQFFNKYDDYYENYMSKKGSFVTIINPTKLIIRECTVNGLKCGSVMKKDSSFINFRVEAQKFRVFKIIFHEN